MKRTFALPDSHNMFYFYMLLVQSPVSTKETNIPMESKLNQAAVSEYSTSFSQKLIQQAYQHTSKLSGQEVLSLTPLKQVNLLVIRAIFLQWKSEVEYLKSPYFDYEASEVKSALADFMNVVSQHISIDQQHLSPLLQQAVQDTLHLILSPYDFYFHLLSNTEKNVWTVPELEESLKYIRINRPLLEKLTERCRQENYERVTKEHVIELYKEVAGHLDAAPEDTEPYLLKFNNVIPLNVDTLYSQDAHPKSRSASFFDTLDSDTEPGAAPKEKQTNEEERRTLNDYLNRQDRSTLADQHRQRKIESLTKHISVNQKFMFIRELFNNDADAYASAIRELDTQSTYAEAINLIRRDFSQNYRWKMDSEEVLEFMELITKRF